MLVQRDDRSAACPDTFKNCVSHRQVSPGACRASFTHGAGLWIAIEQQALRAGRLVSIEKHECLAGMAGRECSCSALLRELSAPSCLASGAATQPLRWRACLAACSTPQAGERSAPFCVSLAPKCGEQMCCALTSPQDYTCPMRHSRQLRRSCLQPMHVICSANSDACQAALRLHVFRVVVKDGPEP